MAKMGDLNAAAECLALLVGALIRNLMTLAIVAAWSLMAKKMAAVPPGAPTGQRPKSRRSDFIVYVERD